MQNKRRVYNIRDASRPKEATYVGRSGKGVEGPWGNPFTVEGFGRGGAVREYEQMVKQTPIYREKLKANLADQDLVCFCAPVGGGGLGPDDKLLCHGQIILRAIRGDYDG